MQSILEFCKEGKAIDFPLAHSLVCSWVLQVLGSEI